MLLENNEPAFYANISCFGSDKFHMDFVESKAQSKIFSWFSFYKQVKIWIAQRFATLGQIGNLNTYFASKYPFRVFLAPMYLPCFFINKRDFESQSASLLCDPTRSGSFEFSIQENSCSYVVSLVYSKQVR